MNTYIQYIQQVHTIDFRDETQVLIHSVLSFSGYTLSFSHYNSFEGRMNRITNTERKCLPVKRFFHSQEHLAGEEISAKLDNLPKKPRNK